MNTGSVTRYCEKALASRIPIIRGLQTWLLLLSSVSHGSYSFAAIALEFLAFWVNLIPRCSHGCWLMFALLQCPSLLATGNAARPNFAQQYRRETLSLWMASVRYGTREPPHVSHAALTVSDRCGPQQWGWWDIYTRHSHMAD